MMKAETILVCIVTLLILLSMPKVIAQPPMPPCVFYGYVYVGGKPARDGLNVTAVISGTTLKWTTKTRSGTYGWPVKGSSSFEIPSDDPETPGKDGGVTGNGIKFYVQGVKINQVATFESGSPKRFDLSIQKIPGEPEQPTLTVSLDCLTTYVGYKVKISGELAYTNGTGIPEANLSLTYSVTGGNSWNNITSVTTTTNGNYYAEWTPTATGNYLIKVSLQGNETPNVGGAEANVSLAFTQLEEKYVFSLISNSTLSELAFNSTSRVLSFTLNGPSGTTGYTNITIAKDLIEETTGLKIHLDGNQIDYTAVSTDASWLLHFTYQHSTHRVIVSLGSPANSYPLYTVVIVIVIGTGAAAVFWIHRKGYRIKVMKKSK
jgi:hypothetical protein